MTKEFHRVSDNITFEFNDNRLKVYKKIRELMEGKQSKLLLSELVNLLRKHRDLPQQYMEITEELVRAGILKSEAMGIKWKPFWRPTIGFKYTYTDQDFMRFVFHQTAKSDDLEFATLRLVDDGIVNGKSVRVLTDIEVDLPRKCLC